MAPQKPHQRALDLPWILAVCGNGCVWYPVAFAFALFQTGYIQADEFFQNPEIVAGDMFNVSHFRPWELYPENALRTISIPYAISGTPFLLVKALEKWTGFHAAAQTLLILPRVSMFLLIPLLELVLRRLSKDCGVAYSSVQTVFRSSYLTFVFLPRTFSNSLEVLFFAVLLHLASSAKSRLVPETLLPVLTGCTSALGIFNRPTFLAFGLVPGIYFLMHSSVRRIFWTFIWGILACAILAAIDSLYFGRLVITPLQFVLYNINSANNAAHGLHPRYFHLLVSLPQLFGPLTIAYLVSAKARRSPKRNFLLLATVVPLGLISLIPHQEPRFLLALMVPIILLGAEVVCSSRFLRNFWTVFNLVLMVFFGFFHQAGVTRSVLEMESMLERNPDAQMFYFKTYIPPFYPLRLPLEKADQVVDFGLNKIELAQVGVRMLEVESQDKVVYLVIPATLPVNLLAGNWTSTLVKRFCPHWSFEAPVDYTELWTRPEQLCLHLLHLRLG